ncbi:MAG: cache domain-containing protein [Acidobacteriia bacterium]|nr:cache domain-containing protein [Terriglobia bacterium]
MKQKGASARTFGVVAMVFMALVIFFGIFFYLHVSKESQYLTERNLRELNRLDSALKERIENYTNKVLPNLVNKAAGDYQGYPKEKSDPCSVKGDAHSRKQTSDMTGEFTCYLDRAATVVPNLRLVSKTVTIEAVSKRTTTSSQSELPPVSLDPKQEGDAFDIYVDYKGPGPDPDHVVSFRAVLRMEDLMRGRRGGVFDDVFIAKSGATGNRVIFQRERSGLLRLDELPPPTDQAGKTEPGKEEKPKPLLPLTVTASGVFPVELAGSSYKLFVQPLRLLISPGTPTKSLTEKTESDTEWVLCGLVQSGRFHDESWALSNPELLLFLFAFVLLMASSPLLKLWSLGPGDELRLADARLVYVSVLTVSSLLTFSLVDLYAYQQLRRQLDNQLSGFADTMATRFSQEVQQLSQLLDRMNNELTKKPVPPEKKIMETSILCQGKDCSHVSWLQPNDPYFDMTAMVMPDGNQVGKWTIEKFSTTRFVSVAERPYFRNIMEERGWNLPSGWRPSTDGQFRFFLEPILSWNSGELQAMLSIPGPNQNGSPRWVTTVVAKLISLQNTAIPPGFGYAVIERGGKIMFHSDPTLSGADFFQECGNDLELQALVFARASKAIDVQCAGREHRMFVKPLNGLPWTLVVFKEWEVAQTANLELLSASLILGIFYGVVFVVPVLFLCLRRPEWMWPDDRRRADYRLLLAANLALIVVLLLTEFIFVPHHHVPVSTLVLPPFALLLNRLKVKGADPLLWKKHPSFLVLLVLPIVLLGLAWWNRAAIGSPTPSWALFGGLLQVSLLCAVFFFVFYPSRSLPPGLVSLIERSGKGPMGSRATYLLATFSLVVILSVLPALAFFRLAHDTEMEILVKHGQFRLVHALVERQHRVKKEYQEVPTPSDYVKARLGDNPDIYAEFFYHTRFNTKALDPAPNEHRFDIAMEKIRPLYDEAGVQPHELVRDETADGSFRWIASTAEIQLVHAPEEAAAFLPMSSNVPALRWPDGFWWWAGLVVTTAAFLLGIYLLLRSVARTAFLLDLVVPDADRVRATHLGAVSENTLLLGPPRSGKSMLLARTAFHRVDIGQIAAAGEWAEALEQELPKDTVLAIDHLEYGMGDPECNGRKLRLLETFLYSNRILLVASTADPLSFSVKISKEEKDAKEAPDKDGAAEKEGKASTKESKCRSSLDADRWATLWSTFTRRVYVMKEADPARDEEKLEDKLKAIARAKLPEAVADKLLQECLPAEQLRQEQLSQEQLRQEQLLHIGMDVAELPDCREFSPGQVVAEILDRARAYYGALWTTCSKAEKTALFDLAQDGFVNAKSTGLRRLLERGLAVRRPDLQPMNESFGRFVVETGVREEVTASRQEEWSHWRVIRGVLLALMIGAALVVYLAVPQLLNYSTAFIGAAAAGIPTLLKLLDLFRGSRNQS